MLWCSKCGVKLAGSPRYCPLCQEEPSGTAEPAGNVFPVIRPVKNVYRGLITFIGFCSVAVVIISVVVNIGIPKTGWWSVFVFAGLASLWVTFLVGMKKRRNIPKNILLQAIVLPIIVFLWDVLTGFHKWSLNFVIPILYGCSMIGMAVFARIRKLQGPDFIIYFVILSIISILSLLLIIFQVVSIVYPALVCFGLSVISLAYLSIIEGKNLISEIRKRMHL